MRTIGLIKTDNVITGDTKSLKDSGIILTDNEEPKTKRTRAKKTIEKKEIKLD